MDDFDSADVVSVTPSIASELSSFAAFSDGGNEAAPATDNGHAESGAGEVARHRVFWFENDIANVEKVAFQVHAHLFTRESDKGRALMSEASGGALVLEDVKAIDFERFLTMLYAKFYDPPKLATAEEWISVLHLAYKWDFASLQAVAARELDPLTTAVDKIVLSQQYGIDFWLERAYLDVCTTDDWLSDEDGLRLGVAAVLKIGRVRHELRMPAALKPETSRLGIVRAAFGLVDAIESSTTALNSGSGSGADLNVASSDNAAGPTSPPPSEPDAESAKESLKSFIENKFGWNGENASVKWYPYARYGKTTEKEALRQAVDDARVFIARADSEGLDECLVASQSAALLDAVKTTFEPIKVCYELWTLSVDAMRRFDDWLDTCLTLVSRDPWMSSANKSQLESSLEGAKRSIARALDEHRYGDVTGQPSTSPDMIDTRHRQLEARLIAILGSCPAMRSSSIRFASEM